MHTGLGIMPIPKSQIQKIRNSGAMGKILKILPHNRRIINPGLTTLDPYIKKIIKAQLQKTELLPSKLTASKNKAQENL